MFKIVNIGDIVISTYLQQRFNGQAPQVLASNNLISEEERQPRQQRRYKINKELPSKEAYLLLHRKFFTTSVTGLVDDAFSEIEELRNEMQERFDNTPESLQQTEVNQAVEEAANVLRDIEQPDIPNIIGELEVFFVPAADLGSRAKRASNAAFMLDTAAAALLEWADEEKNKTNFPEQVEEVEQAADELEELSSTLSDVEFPGMYG